MTTTATTEGERKKCVSPKAECVMCLRTMCTRVNMSECWEHLKLKKTETNNKICSQMFYENMCTFAYSLARSPISFSDSLHSTVSHCTIRHFVALVFFLIFIPSNNNIREQQHNSKMIIIKIITTLHSKKWWKYSLLLILL